MVDIKVEEDIKPSILAGGELDKLIKAIVRIETTEEAIWLRQDVRNMKTAPLVKDTLLEGIDSRVKEMGI